MPDKRRKQVIVQFLKFNAVGLINTAVDFALFTLLLFWGMGSFGAQAVSYAAGTMNSYIMNKKITFSEQISAQERRSNFNISQFIRFAALNAAVLALSLAMLFVLISIAGLHPLASKLIVTTVTVMVNFLGSRKWVFAKKAYAHENMRG